MPPTPLETPSRSMIVPRRLEVENPDAETEDKDMEAEKKARHSSWMRMSRSVDSHLLLSIITHMLHV